MRFGLPQPPSGEEGPSYGEYLRVADLVGLQQLRSNPPQHDETLFIIIHQTYELWFKQLLHELDAIVRHLDADQALGAHRLLGRCITIQRVLIQQVDVLETMTPLDFLSFRDHLRPASGFQSAQFREIEAVGGLGDARLLDHFNTEGMEWARIAERMGGPTLGGAFYALLRRRGFDLPADPEGGAADDPAAAAARDHRITELARLYREAEQHYALMLLAESMLDFDELFVLWRLRHVQMVERTIGGVSGTGGSEGTGYLWRTTTRRFFPELWAVRTRLSAQEHLVEGPFHPERSENREASSE